MFSCLHSPWAVADAYDDVLNAVKLNNIPVAEALFAKGLDVNTVDPSANTLLMLAVRENHHDLIRRLLDLRAKVDARNSYGETALMAAAAKGNMEVVQLLVDRGAAVKQSGWNALIYAAWQGHTAVVKYLLGKGADIDAVSPNGVSALMLAARGGHFETVKLLLWELADPNLKSGSDGSALVWALKAGNSAIAELLRQAGAKE